MSSLFEIDANRGNALFGFVFSYVLEDFQDLPDATFSSVLRETIGSLRISEEVQERLRVIFEATVSNIEPHEEHLAGLTKQFENEKPLLIAAFRLLLKYSTDEGMLSRHDRSRLKNIYLTFDFSEEDFLLLTEEETFLLEEVILQSRMSENSFKKPNVRYTTKLSKMYKTLDCQPTTSDSELKKSYYKLAKRYHPDRKAALKLEDLPASKKEFERVKHAYDTIVRSRKKQTA